MLGIMAYNAKHNQYGCLDEHEVLRHSDVELCAMGALAFLFFSIFHVAGLNPSAHWFMPDLNSRNFREYGRRPWYNHHIFFSTKPEVGLTYEGEFLCRDCVEPADVACSILQPGEADA